METLWDAAGAMPGLMKRLSRSAGDLSPCKRRARSNSCDEEELEMELQSQGSRHNLRWSGYIYPGPWSCLRSSPLTFKPRKSSRKLCLNRSELPAQRHVPPSRAELSLPALRIHCWPRTVSYRDKTFYHNFRDTPRLKLNVETATEGILMRTWKAEAALTTYNLQFTTYNLQ